MTPRRRALLLGLPGLAAFAVAVLLVALPHHAPAAPPAPIAISIGLAFWLSGIVARSRRPDNRMGFLLDVTGILAFLVLLPVSHNAYVFTLGLALNSMVFAAMVHVLLAYPTGSVARRDRRLVVIAYALAGIAPGLSMLFSVDPAGCGDACPRNVIRVTDDSTVESVVTHSAQVGAAALLIAVTVVLVRRWRSASPAYRRTLRGVYGTGVVGVALLGLSFAVGAVSHDLGSAMILGAVVAIGAVPVILLLGLLGPRRARGIVGRVVAELGPAPAPGHLRAVLRSTLHDPGLEVGYWLPDLPGYVDIEGRPFDPVEAPAATYVDGEGGRIGVLTHDAALVNADALDGLVSALRLVLENERLHADLQAKLVEIQQQQSFTDLIVDNAPAFFCVVDADGRLRGGVNDPLLALVGRSHRELADKPFWDVFCVPEEVEATKQRLATVAAGGAPGVQEALLPLPSGERRVVEWRDTVVPDEFGQLKWIVRAGLDVTERKGHEAELRASRVRIVRAADEARRKLERNLHDGAQQRLVSLSITLRLAEARVERDPAGAKDALRGASEELSAALAELRELARGIHPSILTDLGLVPALQALAERATLPVDVVSELEGSLPPAVEAAAYYVVSESLANVSKHAQARRASVRVSRRDGTAYVEVEDDGVGGADAAGGSGLRGLVDRVEALDGQLGVGPGDDGGTRVWAEIPCV